MGSRLFFLLPAWEQIASDHFIHEVVKQGYSLHFVWRPPPLVTVPVETPLPRLKRSLQEGANGGSTVVERPGGFYSHYFLTTKCTIGFHPILRLIGLNKVLDISKFCMETLSSILQGSCIRIPTTFSRVRRPSTSYRCIICACVFSLHCHFNPGPFRISGDAPSGSWFD